MSVNDHTYRVLVGVTLDTNAQFPEALVVNACIEDCSGTC